MGRHSEFRQETADEICTLLAEGKSLRSICQQDDMPDMRTVLRWLAKDEHKSFRHQYALAREAQADALFDETLDIADERSNDIRTNEDGQEIIDHELVQRAKLRIDTRKWIAGKLRPKVYGDKILNEHSGVDGRPIEHKTSFTLDALDSEERDMLRAMIAKRVKE